MSAAEPLATNVAELLAHIQQGRSINYLFFWGHQKGNGTHVGKACLSQWYEAPFRVDEVRYPTAEHYMMAEKARLFGDNTTRAKILTAQTPGAAKALGRAVNAFEEQRWQACRFEIVVSANLHKFGQNPALAEYLLSTGNKMLVEASPVDRIWGIGLAETDPNVRNPAAWQGPNLLGFALMIVRARLSGN